MLNRGEENGHQTMTENLESRFKRSGDAKELYIYEVAGEVAVIGMSLDVTANLPTIMLSHKCHW